MEPKFETNIVICSCGDVRHQLIFSIFEYVKANGTEFTDCYLQIHLNKLSFFSRLWVAIKYIFGCQSKFGAFEEFVIDKENATKIKKCMETFLTKTN